jgi:hypothetical protein
VCENVDCIQLVQNRVSQVEDSCEYCHVLSVNRDEVSNGNSIYWTFTLVTTNNYESHNITNAKDDCNYSTHEVFN